MGYLVLARKWRPQLWDEVVGQSHVTTTLRNAILYHRVAHAYLFTGPRGVGKTSVARILAKALNCKNESLASRPCNACENCVEITNGRSMDVFEIDGASNRGIDEIRNLRETIRYAPTQGKYKIYIIDEVHMLTPEAFNALLKTLEEPPEHVVFVFATTEPHKVPPTIVSRCQRFDFHRIGMSEMVALLKKICEQESISIEEDALHLIARKADGSLRDSESLLEQLISFSEGKISTEEVVRALGLIDQQLFFELTDIIQAKDNVGAMTLVEKIVSSGYSIEEFLSGLLEHLRNLLVVRVSDTPEVLDFSDSYRQLYQRKAKEFQEEDLLRMIRIVTDALYQLKNASNPRIPLELAILKMIKLDRTVLIEDVLAQLKKNESSVESPSLTRDPGLSFETKSSPRTPSASSSVDFETIQNRWPELIARVKQKKITVGSFLEGGIPVRLVEGVLEIGFARCNGFHIDAITRSQGVLLEALKEEFGCPLKFRCIKGDFSPSPLREDKPKETFSSLAEQNDIIKKLKETFEDIEPIP